MPRCLSAPFISMQQPEPLPAAPHLVCALMEGCRPAVHACSCLPHAPRRRTRPAHAVHACMQMQFVDITTPMMAACAKPPAPIRYRGSCITLRAGKEERCKDPAQHLFMDDAHYTSAYSRKVREERRLAPHPTHVHACMRACAQSIHFKCARALLCRPTAVRGAPTCCTRCDGALPRAACAPAQVARPWPFWSCPRDCYRSKQQPHTPPPRTHTHTRQELLLLHVACDAGACVHACMLCLHDW